MFIKLLPVVQVQTKKDKGKTKRIVLYGLKKVDRKDVHNQMVGSNVITNISGIDN